MAAPKLATRQPLPFQLSLRIRHPSIDPEEISKGLGIEPEHTFRAGQPRHSKSGVAPATVHRTDLQSAYAGRHPSPPENLLHDGNEGEQARKGLGQ